MENNFEKKMENLETPETGFVKHQEVLKIGLVNAKKSARIGILFIVIPIVVVILAYIKILVLMHFDFFTNLSQFVNKQNQPNSYVWIFHVILLALPLVGIIVNLLAISHFYINKTTKELIITLKYRFVNVIVLIISVLIFLSVLWYVMFINSQF
jgi:hypothetical protein